MEWLARLEGDEWSFEDLPKWFSQLDHKVMVDDGKYYLTSSWFEHCGTPDGVWEAADQICAWINAICKALDPRFRTVAVGSELVQVQGDGKRLVHHRLRAEPGELRLKGRDVGVLVDGKPLPPQPSKHEKLLAMLGTVSPTSPIPRALDAWLLPTIWQRLRHVCEAIREDTAPGKVGEQAWKEMVRVLAPMVGMAEPTLDGELRRFNKTSAKPEHAGPHALHGYTSGPIVNPMALGEAERLIHQLLVAWLSSKI
jgi:hypothetical protein